MNNGKLTHFGNDGMALYFLRTLVFLLILTCLAGCQLFWFPAPAHMDVKGIWRGEIVALTLYDPDGKPISVPVAGIKIASGPSTETFGHEVTNPPLEPHPTIIVSQDGHHASPLSNYTPGRWIEMSGTVTISPLMGPNSDAVVWERADPAPRLVSGKPDVRLVKFIVPNGSIRDIEPSPAAFGNIPR